MSPFLCNSILWSHQGLLRIPSTLVLGIRSVQHLLKLNHIFKGTVLKNLSKPFNLIFRFSIKIFKEKTTKFSF